MHTHLRAWRINRKLTLEHVGNVFDVRHTTVSRWEKGEMRVSTADLERLADLYQTSITQLMAPPAAADMVKSLDRFQAAIDGLALE